MNALRSGGSYYASAMIRRCAFVQKMHADPVSYWEPLPDDVATLMASTCRRVTGRAENMACRVDLLCHLVPPSTVPHGHWHRTRRLHPPWLQPGQEKRPGPRTGGVFHQPSHPGSPQLIVVCFGIRARQSVTYVDSGKLEISVPGADARQLNMRNGALLPARYAGGRCAAPASAPRFLFTHGGQP